jgi:dipeptidyl aminopeptidase/acylaminoacyl peptidase
MNFVVEEWPDRGEHAPWLLHNDPHHAARFVFYDRAKKYPLMVILHGGPVDVVRANISRDLPYPAEMFLNRGALVLRPNYRGSTGYGRKFRAGLERKLGIGPLDDIAAGIDLLASRGMIDPSRVGAMGWSHGGYLAAFFGVASDRFKADSAGASVSDWRLFYTLGAGGSVKPDQTSTPWNDPEYFRLTSPLTYVGRAKTPMLLQHGASDTTAPLASAKELYVALRDHAVPVKMIIYNNVGHLPGRPSIARTVATHNLEWFDHWILNAPDPGRGQGPD